MVGVEDLKHCDGYDNFNTLEFDSFGFWRCTICGTNSKNKKYLRLKKLVNNNEC